MIPSNVKVGDYLKTRDGQKVKVLHVHRNGHITVLKEDCVYTVHPDGRYSLSRLSIHADIIGPWVEPQRVRVIVALRTHGEMSVFYQSHRNRLLSAGIADGSIIGAAEVELVEGQFPPGVRDDNRAKPEEEMEGGAWDTKEGPL